ncbi:MAG: archease [Acidimicrobiia bacterium]|nr:archease [Acidimicrobiia bacterium]
MTSLLEHNGIVRRFEILPHTADVAVAVYGESVSDLFANAASALFELMFEMDSPRLGPTVRVEATGDGLEELLVAWLSELLAIAEVDGVALADFEVTVTGDNKAAGSATAIPVEDLVMAGTPIKAVTYHELRVREVGGIWTATIVFDV